MGVTEWIPGESMGIEHQGVVTGSGRFTLATARERHRLHVGEELTFPWWMGGAAGATAAKPVLRAVWQRNLRNLKRLVENSQRTRVPSSLRRVTKYAMSVAGIQTLGTDLTLDVVREADALGYDSAWVAEANAAEAMSLLGAISQAAPHLGLGTGVLALQLRTPPLHAMAAATLQQLAGDRSVYLGVGISSPAVAGQWHGAGYTDRPIAQVREFVTLMRECLAGEAVTFEGDFYTVKRFRLGVRLGEHRPKIFVAALNEQMLRLAGAIADGVLLNYLPASLVPVVHRARARGRRRRGLRVRPLRRDRPRPLRRPRPQGPAELRGRRRVREPVRARGFEHDVADFRDEVEGRERDAALAAIGDAWVDDIQIMGDAAHVRAKVDAYEQAGAKPIVFALPWGEDRRDRERDTQRPRVNAGGAERAPP